MVRTNFCVVFNLSLILRKRASENRHCTNIKLSTLSGLILFLLSTTWSFFFIFIVINHNKCLWNFTSHSTDWVASNEIFWIFNILFTSRTLVYHSIFKVANMVVNNGSFELGGFDFKPKFYKESSELDDGDEVNKSGK